MANNTGLAIGDEVTDGTTRGRIVSADWSIDYIVVNVYLFGQPTMWTVGPEPAENWWRALSGS